MIHVANDENYDANDVSAGVSMSRTSRSCFNSTNGPTGTTTVPPSANVSIAQPSNLETIGDEKGAQNIRVINGNLAPPNQNRRFNRTSSPPQTPSFDRKDILTKIETLLLMHQASKWGQNTLQIFAMRHLLKYT